ncbi:hypothetical protein [Acidithrix ferrooxidans]|uniref:Uncharacterized protein n=1 Tax=Acidithrix ferrooxidans TaxID=1280514 RepID=A0A0D8HHN2_9ACTN|nr:hypothetical protein [Acidithrix ferrooxidans]KJF17344.1 hypothetical protein AXFE_17830 [Acidithrix ferrooxidans]
MTDTDAATHASRYSFRRLLPIVIFVAGLAIGAVSALLIPWIANSTNRALGTLVGDPGEQVIASGTGSGTQEIPVMNRSAMRFHRLGLSVTCVGPSKGFALVQVYIPGESLPFGVEPLCGPNGGGMLNVAEPTGTIGYPDKIIVRASSSIRWSFMVVNPENTVGVVLIH